MLITYPKNFPNNHLSNTLDSQIQSEAPKTNSWCTPCNHWIGIETHSSMWIVAAHPRRSPHSPRACWSTARMVEQTSMLSWLVSSLQPIWPVNDYRQKPPPKRNIKKPTAPSGRGWTSSLSSNFSNFKFFTSSADLNTSRENENSHPFCAGWFVLVGFPMLGK